MLRVAGGSAAGVSPVMRRKTREETSRRVAEGRRGNANLGGVQVSRIEKAARELDLPQLQIVGRAASRSPRSSARVNCAGRESAARAASLARPRGVSSRAKHFRQILLDRIS